MVNLALWLLAACVVGAFLFGLAMLLLSLFNGLGFKRVAKQIRSLPTSPATKEELNDELYKKVAVYAKGKNLTAKQIQNEFGIGFARAARIVEVLREQGKSS